MRYVKIPADRVAAVIGEGGSTRAFIERRVGVKIQVNSDENEVLIDDTHPEDPLGPLKAEEVVKAIGRGFSPERAYRLFAEDQYFQLFDLHEYVGKSSKHMERLKARVIGADGKTRRIIEDLTGCAMSIYGHTVALIGDAESLQIAVQAVEMLLSGSEHANVYRYLEGRRREAKRARLDM